MDDKKPPQASRTSPPVSSRIRERVVAQWTVFSLDEVGRRLYNAMRQHAKCKPLPEADCIVIGDGALRWLDHR